MAAHPRGAESRGSYGGRVFDLGCGNGAFAAKVVSQGYEVTGVDPSEEGIQRAETAYPQPDIHVGLAHDDLRLKHGTFDAVVSLELVEHMYYPRRYAACVLELLEQGGSYNRNFVSWVLENLALALTGKMDEHFTPLWTHDTLIPSTEDDCTLLGTLDYRKLPSRRAGLFRLLKPDPSPIEPGIQNRFGAIGEVHGDPR